MRFLSGSLGWGIVIYAIMYLAWSGLIIYGLTGGALPVVARIALLAFITIVAARSLRLPTWNDLVPYTLSWAGVAACLDALFILPYSGLVFYADWSVWVGYVLVAAIPLVATVVPFRALR